ncbi:MAG: TPM domain-containing protein [Bacteroidetes bacterium]|nr:TPM domain-containing protein [Bacteroidota bacterium]MCK5765113.1 TPM domain-containing protein [Bacteroidales bacterium]
MSQSAKDFFSGEQRDDIKQAIMNAELDTSGEIRVHIDSKCKGEVMDRAFEVFKKLKIHDTGLRNGVLFYLAVKNRKFAIIGDKGINEIVPEDFWEELKSDLLDAFREGNFTDGLIDGITRTGTHLKQHFPYQTDDVNELSDEISFEN